MNFNIGKFLKYRPCCQGPQEGMQTMTVVPYKMSTLAEAG